MKYYTERIPVTLAEKLKEKGMPDIEIKWNPIHGKHHCFKTYAEVFDWLINSRIDISVVAMYKGMFKGHVGKDTYLLFKSKFFGTWHEAANATIEKAIELLKD